MSRIDPSSYVRFILSFPDTFLKCLLNKALNSGVKKSANNIVCRKYFALYSVLIMYSNSIDYNLLSIQVPAFDSRNITSMTFLRYQVHMLEDVLNVLPILHQEMIGLIQDNNFD